VYWKRDNRSGHSIYGIGDTERPAIWTQRFEMQGVDSNGDWTDHDHQWTIDMTSGDPNHNPGDPTSTYDPALGPKATGKTCIGWEDDEFAKTVPTSGFRTMTEHRTMQHLRGPDNGWTDKYEAAALNAVRSTVDACVYNYMACPMFNSTTNEWTPLSERLVMGDFNVIVGGTRHPGRGRMQPFGDYSYTSNEWQMDWTPTSVKQPSVPWACMFQQYFTTWRMDETRPDDPRRIYGKFNINTVDRWVLDELPNGDTRDGWLNRNEAYISRNSDGWRLDMNGDGEPDDSSNDAIGQSGDLLSSSSNATEYLIKYRDRRSISAELNYGDREAATKIENLRPDGGRFYATPGEVMIPLGQMMDVWLAGKGFTDNFDVLDEAVPYWHCQRFRIARRLVDYFTVRSDSYAVVMQVQLYNRGVQPNATATNYKRRWQYYGLIDRSNVTRPHHEPQVLTFFEMK
jgi:hypothetical protein